MSKSVLIVDDSALVRKQVREILQPEGYEIEIAKNGKEAVDKALSIDYDVITMDVNMPVMDGLTAVSEIMKANPTAILMISSLTSDDATTTMDALDLGAIDYIAKPGTMNVGKEDNRLEIIQKVKSLSRIPKRRLARQARRPVRRERPQNLEDTSKGDSRDISKVVLIGSSTGGPGLIEQICAALPTSFTYPVCIVQHMPAQFTKAFAERLNRVSSLPVLESKQNLELLPGHVYVARGGVHMHFAKKVSGKIVIREDTDKGEHFFQPAVDETFASAEMTFDGKQLIAVLLTGIGDDGADGMVSIRKAGGYTIGESENSATVYGMPKEAYERGGVMEQLDFKDILKKIATLK